MIHTFDSDIAAKYGVNAAILLQIFITGLRKTKRMINIFMMGIIGRITA